LVTTGGLLAAAQPDHARPEPFGHRGEIGRR